MPAFSKALADHFHDHLGVVSDTQLRALEVTLDQRRRMVTQGLLVPMFAGVYRARSSPVTLESRCLAISLSDERAVITGRAAGKLWKLRKLGGSPTIEVRVPHFRHTLAGGDDVVLRRCSVLDDVDIVRDRPDGIRVVSPPRLLFDLSASLDDESLESVMEQVLDKKWCTIPTLFDTGRRLWHPSRPGSMRFARVLGSRPVWQKPVDSDLEMRLHRALDRAGVQGIVRQHPLPLPSGWSIHADLAVPSLQWAIPVDHVTWHGGRIDAQRDKQNDRLAHAIGWQVDRVTDDDIELHLKATTKELVGAWRRRRAQFDRGTG